MQKQIKRIRLEFEKAMKAVKIKNLFIIYWTIIFIIN